MTEPAMLAVALDYANQGRPVFPCHTPTPGGCSCTQPDCGSPGKHPRTRQGLRDASTDPRTIAEWWNRWPDANIGLVTGQPSGLVVVDVDVDHDGVESMQQLIAAHSDLPLGPRVRTGSGGWHLLFAAPNHSVRNSVGQVGPGIDVRADGGYIIAPPSLHPTGNRYRWTRAGDPPPLPSWLARIIDPPAPQPQHRSAPIHVADSLANWAAAALRGELDRVRHAPKGTRNQALNRAAFSLGQIAGAGALDADAIAAHLHDAALATGLGDREASLTIRSGLTAGIARPRTPVHDRSPAPRHVEPSASVDIDIT